MHRQGFKPLYIIKQPDMPKVILNHQKNIFKIQGNYLADEQDAKSFNSKILNWLTTYRIYCTNPVNLIFEMGHINAFFIQFLLGIEEVQVPHLRISWLYVEDDIDREEFGKEMRQLMSTAIDLVTISYSGFNKPRQWLNIDVS